MYSNSSNLSQISLKNSFGEVFLFLDLVFFFFKFWSRDYFRETKICFLAAILKRNKFLFLIWFYLVTFFLLEYGYIYCMYIWCRNHIRIPVGKWFS